jgi:endonuclease/exonuclease/phosphatase family metal-dependent hydrolase
MQFRLVTYNIHKGIGGLDRLYRPERIVATLAHYQPDVVLLQEVDEGVPRSRHHRQVDLIGEELGLTHRAYQANVRLREGHYGNAILSRFPITDVEHLELTVPLKKRRRALAVRCRVPCDGHHTRSVVIFNFHLGLAGYERTIQLRRFLACHWLKHIHHQTALIAAGDFNDVWGRLGRRMLEPMGFHPAGKSLRTYPAILPLRPLDRIYFRGGLKLLNCFASRIDVARKASDHLPMVAEFALDGPHQEGPHFDGPLNGSAVHQASGGRQPAEDHHAAKQNGAR